MQNANDAAQRLRSDSPGSVSVRFAHGGQVLTTVIKREKRSTIYMSAGLKIISGVVVPPDTSVAEVKRMLAFDGRRRVSQAFQSSHYPNNPALFYGGFELFLLRDPTETMVGGIEDGPAARAGVHWGDVVLTVNGQSTASQSASQLEQLLSSTGPKMMHLEVNRLGLNRTFAFRLEQAADIARQNQKRYVGGKVLPAWVSDRDLRCFEVMNPRTVRSNDSIVGRRLSEDGRPSGNWPSGGRQAANVQIARNPATIRNHVQGHS